MCFHLLWGIGCNWAGFEGKEGWNFSQCIREVSGCIATAFIPWKTLLESSGISSADAPFDYRSLPLLERPRAAILHVSGRVSCRFVSRGKYCIGCWECDTSAPSMTKVQPSPLTSPRKQLNPSVNTQMMWKILLPECQVVGWPLDLGPGKPRCLGATGGALKSGMSRKSATKSRKCWYNIAMNEPIIAMSQIRIRLSAKFRVVAGSCLCCQSSKQNENGKSVDWMCHSENQGASHLLSSSQCSRKRKRLGLRSTVWSPGRRSQGGSGKTPSKI